MMLDLGGVFWYSVQIMAWVNLCERLDPYLVRIETPNGYGTGFLFGYNKPHTVPAIATAAHVVSHAHDWGSPIKIIHHASGREMFLESKQRAIFVDRVRDAASIMLFEPPFTFPPDPLPLIKPSEMYKVGVEVGWLGFPCVSYPQLCFFCGAISAVVSKEDYYLIDGVAINGVSGGPVFVDNGRKGMEIVGLVTAYIPNLSGTNTLPGLLRAQDITPFDEVLQKIWSIDEAREKEEEAKRKTEKQPPPAEVSPASDATGGRQRTEFKEGNGTLV
jgi:Trypsin-like peptidase domain